MCAGENASLAQMTALAGDVNASLAAIRRATACAPLREHWDAVLGDGVCRHGAKGLLIVWVAEALAACFLLAAMSVNARLWRDESAAAAAAAPPRGGVRAAAAAAAIEDPLLLNEPDIVVRVEDVSVVGARAADDRGRNAAASARAPALPL